MWSNERFHIFRFLTTIKIKQYNNRTLGWATYELGCAESFISQGLKCKKIASISKELIWTCFQYSSFYLLIRIHIALTMVDPVNFHNSEYESTDITY